MVTELCETDKSSKSIRIHRLYLNIQDVLNEMSSEDIIIWCNYHSLSDAS